MKKLLIRLFALLIFTLIVFVLSTRIPSEYSNYFYGDVLKEQKLTKTISPKIILIGGSNLAFGINSKQLSDHFGMPVVNMGLHAGLGLRYMINEAKPFIHPNDLIIVVPEYNHFYENGTFNGDISLLFELIDANRNGFRYLDKQNYFTLIPISIQYVSKKYFDCLSQLGQKLFFHKMITDSIYIRNAFNDNGDVTTHLTSSSGGFAPHKSHAGIKLEVIRFLNDFAAYSKNKSATVLFSYPDFQDVSFQNSLKSIREIEQNMKKSAIFPIINTPDEYKMESRYFYDTPYHLTAEGIKIRMNMLILDLDKAGIKNGTKK